MTKVRIIDNPAKQRFTLETKKGIFSSWKYYDSNSYQFREKGELFSEMIATAKKLEAEQKTKVVYETSNFIKGPS